MDTKLFENLVRILFGVVLLIVSVIILIILSYTSERRTFKKNLTMCTPKMELFLKNYQIRQNVFKFLCKKGGEMIIICFIIFTITFFLSLLIKGPWWNYKTPENWELIRKVLDEWGAGLKHTSIYYLFWKKVILEHTWPVSIFLSPGTSVWTLSKSYFVNSINILALSAGISIFPGIIICKYFLNSHPKQKKQRKYFEKRGKILVVRYLTTILIAIPIMLVPIFFENYINLPNFIVFYPIHEYHEMIIAAICTSFCILITVFKGVTTPSQRNCELDEDIAGKNLKGYLPWRIIMAIKENLGFIIGCTILIELSINIAGFGNLFVLAIENRDYFVITFLITSLSAFLLTIKLICEVTLAFLDPRLIKD